MSDLKLIIRNNDKSLFNTGMHSHCIDESGTMECITLLKYKDIQGSYKEIICEHFKIGHAQFEVKKKTSVDFIFRGQTMEMGFVLKGTCILTTHGYSNDFPFNENEYNVFFSNDSSGSITMDPKNYNLLFVHLDPLFFTKYLPNEKLFELFKTNIHTHKAGHLLKRNAPIVPKIHELLNELITCKRAGAYRIIHLESKILELLLTQLDQIKGSGTKSPIKALSETDRKKIEKAHHYVSTHYRNPLNLHELAKKIGTNEFILKKGFKLTYETTIFGFIGDLRMENAKKLLLENELSINEISEYIGYKNPQHFSTAFKKKYKVSPRQLKNSNI